MALIDEIDYTGFLFKGLSMFWSHICLAVQLQLSPHLRLR
jgi:hypothetical protein